MDENINETQSTFTTRQIDCDEDGTNGSNNGGKGLSIAALVLGILSLVCCCIPGVNGLFGLLALIFAIVVLAKGKGGKGLAIAALVLSIIGTALSGYIVFKFFTDPTAKELIDAARNGDQAKIESIMDSIKAESDKN